MTLSTAAPALVKTAIPFSKTGQFRKIYLDYTAGAEALKPFYRFPASLDGIGKMIEARKGFPQDRRDALADVLLDQYHQAGILTADRQGRIESLRNPNTFTVTTGHQLSIGMGPQYVAFKILTVIKLAQLAKARYPAYEFVPIMWLSGEDHDIEEISSVRVNGRDLPWYTKEEGPAGFLSTKGLWEVFQEEVGTLEPILEKYASYPNLADAQAYLNDALFGDLGIIGLNASDKRLKQFAVPLFEKELTESFSHPLVEEEGRKLERLGYHAQIVTRPINLFWMEPGHRQRIEATEDGGFQAGKKIYSKEEMLALLRRCPENFSPNVATRPMYQEVILPNLAYIGGPAEVAYWLMLGPAFEAAGVGLPVIWPRQNMLIATPEVMKAWREAGFEAEDLFQPIASIHKTYIRWQAGLPDTSPEWLAWQQMFSGLRAKAEAFDANLARSIAADEMRLEKQREKIFRKVEKAFERQFSSELKTLAEVREFFLPGNTLQERVESFLTLHLRNPQMARQLLEVMEPETAALLLIEEGHA